MYIDPAGKLLQHADRLAEAKRGKTSAPVNVEIDLSNRCNLGCLGCHMQQMHSKGYHASTASLDTGDLMDAMLAEDILWQLREIGTRSVTWTGGGEASLNPDFDRILALRLLPQGLYTNGTLISEKRAELLKTRMEWVYVSLDRATRESYRAYKQADLFDHAVAGIKHLAAAKGRATVGVGFLLDASTWRDLTQMAAFALGLGADYVQFRPQVEPGKETGWIEKALPLIHRAAEQPGVIIDPARFEMLLNWEGHGYAECHWSLLQAVITADGRVWRCVNRRGFDGDCLGNLRHEGFAAIWKRAEATKVDGACRMMCRGHLPNIAITRAFAGAPHGEFI